MCRYIPEYPSRNRCEQSVVWKIGREREQAKEGDSCADLRRLDQDVGRDKSGDDNANDE